MAKVKRSRRKPEIKWKTLDGRVIPIAKMETIHIIRALRMLMRESRKIMISDGLEALTYSGGEMATYCAHQAGDQLLTGASRKKDQLDYAIRSHKKAKALFLELEKRKFSAVEALLI